MVPQAQVTRLGLTLSHGKQTIMSKYLSQLTHIEIYATDLEESVDFYEDKIGLRVIDRDGDRVFLRGWGDWYAYSLVLRPGTQPGLVRAAWRTNSDEALDEVAARIHATEYAGRWLEPAGGIGRSYEFTGPYGHTFQLYWERDLYEADGEWASTYPDRPQRRTVEGIAPRHLDHLTLAASDVEGFTNWHRDVLGFRIMGYGKLPEPELTYIGFITTNEKSHDLAVLLDASDVPGRIDHYAYWLDTPQQVTAAADYLIERGVPIEFGPGYHGLGEQNFIYFRDPSRLRLEVNSGGYRNYVPDWEPKFWSIADGVNDMFRNQTLPPSMLESFPPAPGPTATEQGLVPGTEAALEAAAMRAHNLH